LLLRTAFSDLHLLAARLKASFWFVPALVVVASMALGMALVAVDGTQATDLGVGLPRLFGAGAAGSRAMLSAIATSMITVAGVVFSITMVTLSLTSTQYSPRVLRNFMRDRPTQVVLGIFLGIFAYCLVVLRTIRGGDEGTFIPSLSVLGGMAYAFVGIGTLIFFIHHIALSIQAASIVQRIASDTASAMDHVFPAQAEGQARAQPHPAAVCLPLRWIAVTAPRTGYVQAVHLEALLQLGDDCGRIVRLCVPVGGYVAKGTKLLEVGGDGELDEPSVRGARAAVAIGRQRNVEQDPEFGLQQLVDIALRALSTGVNDPTTACLCVRGIGTLLADLAARQQPACLHFCSGTPRVIAPVPAFGDVVQAALGPVLRHARGDVQVLGVAASALAEIAAAAEGERRRALAPAVRELSAAVSQVRPRRAADGLRREVHALALRVGSQRRARGAPT
jgi:uncharacterized membrane protein